jgi:hypothetical protein
MGRRAPSGISKAGSSPILRRCCEARHCGKALYALEHELMNAAVGAGKAAPTHEWRAIRMVQEAEAILGKKKGRPMSAKCRDNIRAGKWPERGQKEKQKQNGNGKPEAVSSNPLIFSTGAHMDRIVVNSEDAGN